MYIQDPDAPRVWPLLLVVKIMTVTAVILEWFYSHRLPELRLIEVGAMFAVVIWASAICKYCKRSYYMRGTMYWIANRCRRWMMLMIVLKIIGFVLAAIANT